MNIFLSLQLNKISLQSAHIIPLFLKWGKRGWQKTTWLYFIVLILFWLPDNATVKWSWATQSKAGLTHPTWITQEEELTVSVCLKRWRIFSIKEDLLKRIKFFLYLINFVWTNLYLWPVKNIPPKNEFLCLFWPLYLMLAPQIQWVKKNSVNYNIHV